jgi:hypothetical protein
VRSTFYKLIKNNNENKIIATNSKEIELATELTLTTNKKLFLIEYQKSNSTMIFVRGYGRMSQREHSMVF